MTSKTAVDWITTALPRWWVQLVTWLTRRVIVKPREVERDHEEDTLDQHW